MRERFPSTRDTLDTLLANGQIRIRRGAIFDRPPVGRPQSWSRVEGMLLGLAIGDALGNTSEGLLPARRARLFDEIRDYQPNHHAEGRRVGLPSDDSQLAFWTLEQLVTDGRYVPEHLAARFCQEQIFGIGTTVRQFIGSFKDRGEPWHAAGPESAGNGALMRIAPMVVPHVAAPSADLWVDTALSAMTTHNDCAAIGSAVAFASILWDLMAMNTPPPPRWWIESFGSVFRDLETDRRYSARGGRFAGFSGRFSDFVEQHVLDALERNLPAREACDEWYSGAYLLETVPSVLYILARHAGDPEEAIVRAVNDTCDNDTTAAIVGAAVGALHGRDALPERWRHGLLGRTGVSDDGRVFELIEQARRALWRGDQEPPREG